MYCQKCGAENKNDSSFCVVCGYEIVSRSSEGQIGQSSSVDKAVIEKSGIKSESGIVNSILGDINKENKSNKKRKYKYIFAGLLVLLVIIGMTKIFNSKRRTNIIFITDGKYNYMNDKGEKEVRLTDYRVDSSNNKCEPKFSNDGRFVFLFVDDFVEDKKNYGKLFRVDCNKLNDIMMISDCANSEYILLDDDTLIFNDCDGNLYNLGIGTDSIELIDENVSWFDTDGSDILIYARNNDVDKLDLLSIDINNSKETKIDGNVVYIKQFIDLEHVVYLRSDGQSYYYMVGGVNGRYELGDINSVEILGECDGKIYFTYTLEDKILLYDYVRDSFKDSDAKIPKPNSDDYYSEEYLYQKIDDDLKIVFCDEVWYISCTNKCAFFDEIERGGLSIEEMANSGDKYNVDYANACKAFVDKYKEQENSEGYIKYSESIKRDLIRLARDCGNEKENAYCYFCFQYFAESDYDEDGYNKAVKKYEEVEVRNKKREMLNDDLYSIEKKNVYYIENGEKFIVCENVIFTEKSGDNILYYTAAEISEDEKPKLIWVNTPEDITEYVYNLERMKVQLYNMRKDEAYDITGDVLEELYNVWNMEEGIIGYYISGDKLFYDKPLDGIYCSEIKDNCIEFPQLVAEQAYVKKCTEDGFYYYIYSSRSSDKMDLYEMKDGVSKRLAGDIYNDKVVIYEDDYILSYKDDNNDGIKELVLFNENGEEETIAEGVTSFSRIDKGNIIYISDMTLSGYVMTKGTYKIKKNVERFWANNNMSIKCTLVDDESILYR